MHYKLNLECKPKDGKLEQERYTIRRVGCHSRRDAEGLQGIKGLPWEWSPDSGVPPGEFRARFLTEEKIKQVLRHTVTRARFTV